VAIGLAFTFGVMAALVSVITELFASLQGLRGAYLLRGLRELLDGTGGRTALGDAISNYDEVKSLVAGRAPGVTSTDAAAPHEPATRSATGALLGSPILRSQGMVGDISSRKLAVGPSKPGRSPRVTATGGALSSWRDRRSLPSYISARSISDAVIGLIAPNAAGQTTMAQVQHGIDALPDWAATLKTSLQSLATCAGKDVDLFRASVESWYDDHMARVSGWYKRHVAKISLAIGAILVVLLNINALTIGSALYGNAVVREAVSSVAAKTTSCEGQTQQGCLADLQSHLSATTLAGLPIGWTKVADCTAPKSSCNWLDQRGIFSRHGGSGWKVALVLIGFLITIIALIPGARFWFDLLSRLGSLRSTGPKPAT
jgi:hypothetical protein